MSIRNKLQQREEARDKANGPGINEGLPEGVTRYVYLSKELAKGKNFVMLADPDEWYFYYVHEDGDFATRTNFFQKHTCIHSPKTVDVSKFDSYAKPNPSECLSCKAKAKRKLYFMVPVYDFEYKTWRVLDLKEYHAQNLVNDYDKLEKAAKKFNKAYTLVGDAVSIKKTTDGKTYSLESAETEGLEAELEAAKALLAEAFPYDDLAFFREEDSIREILLKGDDSKIDKSVLGGVAPVTTPKADEAPPITDADAPPAINF